MKLNIPPEHQHIFQRLMESVAPEIRKDINFQKTTLMYLTLGGERMARHHIETSQMLFPDRSSLFEYVPVAEPVTDSDEPQTDNNE